jgi:hypothetical protein
MILRPDSHIAWRGDAVPVEPGRLLDRLRGAASRQTGREEVTDTSTYN